MRRILESERRNVFVGVRCTSDQRQALQAHAQAHGQTVSTFLWALAMADIRKARKKGAQSTD